MACHSARSRYRDGYLSRFQYLKEEKGVEAFLLEKYVFSLMASETRGILMETLLCKNVCGQGRSRKSFYSLMAFKSVKLSFMR